MTGSFSREFTSSVISGGMVAEKKSVCFFWGSHLSIFFTSWIKPISSNPVGFVQDKNFQMIGGDQPLVVEINEPARSGYQDIHPPLQRLGLGGLTHAAENDGVAQLQILAVGRKALSNLDGQLAGRGEDQSTDRTAGGGRGGQPLENGGGKGAGFARASLGTAQYVPGPSRQGE